MGDPAVTDDERRQLAVTAWLLGTKATAIAERYDVDPRTLYGWLRGVDLRGLPVRHRRSDWN
jgi:uncharacterized protein YjcR